MADPAVRFILDVGDWQRGYDLAADLPAAAANPYDPASAAFYGFAEGQADKELAKEATDATARR